jgi:hypothetical protein
MKFQQVAPNAVAFTGVVQDECAVGDVQRRLPTGGWAYGIPLKDKMPFASRGLPKIGPSLVVMLEVRVLALTVRRRLARANEREAFMATGSSTGRP